MANESVEENQNQSEQNSHSLRSSESIYKSTCHNYPSDEHLKEMDKKKLFFASIICLVFMSAEIVGGFISNSLAIVSDAAHMLTDFSAFMVSLLAIWISTKSRTKTMSFGFHRAEILAALLSVLSIWLVTGILVYIAVERVLNPTYDIDATIMIYVAIGGIAANIAMAVSLSMCIDGNAYYMSLQNGSINIRSAAIHVLGDLIQSVGVFFAGLIIYFRPDWKIADPICTFIFSFIVLSTTLYVLRDVVNVLMEGVPKNLNFKDVRGALYSIEGVIKVHNLRIWSLTMERCALSAHIVIRKDVNPAEVLRKASEVIHSKLNIYEVTVQVEVEGHPACLVCE